MLIYEKVTDPMSFIFSHAKQNYEALLKTHICHLCQQACFECRLVTKDELLIWSQALAYPRWPSNSSVWRWRHIELQPGLSRVPPTNAWQAQERLSGRLVELRIPCVENVPVQNERNNAARRSFRIRSAGRVTSEARAKTWRKRVTGMLATQTKLRKAKPF